MLAGLLALATAGCGGGSSSVAGEVDSGIDGAGGLSIVACSLGCSAGVGSGPIGCAVNSIYVNQSIAIEFDKPIAPASVGPNSFLVVAETGSSPSGQYLVDPHNPRRVIFRPQLTFGSDGLPKFGFTPGLSYTIEIPAAAPNQSGFFIQAVSGAKNATPLDCHVVPTVEIIDAVAGPPVVVAWIEELIPGGAVLDAFSGPDGVAPNARLRFEFDDIMNPATLLNTVTGTSDFIDVRVDLDGDLTDPSDQFDVPGQFDIEIAQGFGENATAVVFVPTSGFPSAGSDPDQPRRIVVELQSTIADLGGNPLANAGQLSFTTTLQPAQEELLAATFAVLDESLDATRSSMLRDAAFSGSAPGGAPVEGRMLRGIGGGSGRLGDLRVAAGEEVVLSTGPAPTTIFGPGLTTGAVVDDQGTQDPSDDVVVAYHVATTIVDAGLYPADWATNGVDGDGPGESTAPVADGVFEFASLSIEPGGRLRFVGANPARLFVRGDADVRGAIVAQGGTAPAQLSTLGFGGAGGVGGPGAGAGGRGGDRAAVSAALVQQGGFEHAVGATVDVDGAAGEGRGGTPPTDGAGAGVGGSHFPAQLPGPAITDLGDFQPNSGCMSVQVGVPGGGGGYALAGAAPVYSTPLPATGVPAPPVIEPANDDLAPADTVALDPDRGGALIGGAGGGGGGLGITYSLVNGLPQSACQEAAFGDLALIIYRDASAAGGGGGGGALQLQVGRRIVLSGPVALTGGDGGDAVPGSFALGTPTAPGGGGSGGALLLQAFDLELAPYPGLLDVRGGDGGVNSATGSSGGAGGAGVVHVENSAHLAASLPPGVAVDDPLDVAAISASIQPVPTAGPDATVPASDVLGLGPWDPATVGPGATVGLQTCWLRPSPGSFEVEFLDDPSGAGAPAWDVTLELTGALGTTAGELVSYRGDPGSLGALTGGASLAEFLGNTLGTPTCGCTGSVIAVRFQGVRLVGDVFDPCAIEFDDPAVLGESLTPWLASPPELSAYWSAVLGQAGGLAAVWRPNALRAQVLIDGADPLAAAIGAVVEVSIGALTD